MFWLYWKELEKIGLTLRAVWLQSLNSTEPGIKEQSRVPALDPIDVSRIQCTHTENAQPPSQWTCPTHLDPISSCSWCGEDAQRLLQFFTHKCSGLDQLLGLRQETGRTGSWAWGHTQPPAIFRPSSCLEGSCRHPEMKKQM